MDDTLQFHAILLTLKILFKIHQALSKARSVMKETMLKVEYKKF